MQILQASKAAHQDAVQVRGASCTNPFIKICRNHGTHPISGVQLKKQAAVNASINNVRPLDAILACNYR